MGEDFEGVVRTDPAPVSRLTMASVVEAGDWAIKLPCPLFLHVGEHVWIVGSSVLVRAADGGVSRHEGDGFWLCR